MLLLKWSAHVDVWPFSCLLPAFVSDCSIKLAVWTSATFLFNCLRFACFQCLKRITGQRRLLWVSVWRVTLNADIQFPCTCVSVCTISLLLCVRDWISLESGQVYNVWCLLFPILFCSGDLKVLLSVTHLWHQSFSNLCRRYQKLQKIMKPW